MCVCVCVCEREKIETEKETVPLVPRRICPEYLDVIESGLSPSTDDVRFSKILRPFLESTSRTHCSVKQANTRPRNIDTNCSSFLTNITELTSESRRESVRGGMPLQWTRVYVPIYAIYIYNVYILLHLARGDSTTVTRIVVAPALHWRAVSSRSFVTLCAPTELNRALRAIESRYRIGSAVLRPVNVT